MKIETITAGRNSASYCPERGGIITSIIVDGTELLYLDQQTFEDTSVNVKGGIPILFPNAGGLPDSPDVPKELVLLKRHGFVRESSKWHYATQKSEFYEMIHSSDQTLFVYPYFFTLEIFGDLIKNGLQIDQRACCNSGHSMPISMGLHPYFRVPQGDKRAVGFDFPGGEIIKEQADKWINGKAVSIARPSGDMHVSIPGLGELVLSASEEYERIWIWSQPGKDFVCIEPVMRDSGSIATNPVMVETSQAILARFIIRLVSQST